MENFPRQVQPVGFGQLGGRQAFLRAATPFDLLPAAEIETVSANLTELTHAKNHTLFVQEETILPHVIIVQSGRLERVIEENGKPSVKEILGPRRIYGGISLLFNNGISTSTVRCAEDVTVYALDRENFLRLCVKHPEFARYFSRSMDEVRKRPSPAGVTGDVRVAEPVTDAFMWKPVGHIARGFPSCPAGTSIRGAAELISASGRSAIVVLDDQSRPAGLITDDDLRKKVIVAGRSAQDPVETIMSGPLIQISSQVPVFEAVLTMMRRRIKHLPVFAGERIQGVITERDLLLEGTQSPVFLVHEIQNARETGQLKQAYAKLPEVVTRLLSSGLRAGHVNGIITAITDAVLSRVMEMTLADMGAPPAKFAFLLFGSEGRKEQTLKTDQDNAIVYADPAEPDRESVNRYFLELGTRVCDQLHEIGQQHCEFNIMAKNPDWCQPLSVWKKYYRKWVISDDPDRILNAGIFFDFRLGHGSQKLVDHLYSALFAELTEWPGLLRHMARNTLHYRPPLGFFGNFVLQEKGRGKGALDIKSAMRLVVDFGRIYAMQTQLTETNTVRRLRALYDQQRLDKEAFDDLVHAYEFLMHQRLMHQSRFMESGQGEVNNYLRPGDLTTIDQQALKEAFKQIRVAQAKLRVDFFLYLP
jgi:CBS domain-containing protein